MSVTWADVREALRHCAEEKREWAGMPIPVPGLRLVLEKSYPYPAMNGMALDLPEEKEEPLGFRVVNSWRSGSRRCHVYIIEEPDGHREKVLVPDGSVMGRIRYAMHTLGVASSGAWSMVAEAEAQEKLLHHVGRHKFQQYMLSGTFLETSPRSGVTYVFRRLRPTLALRPWGDDMKVLCALCLHPLGYYERSHAGVMVPTDCVLAHLLLMRWDEHHFWRKANQHRPWDEEAGI